MRDGAIVGMQQANARRSALLLNQLEFLQTRLEAVERVVRVSKLTDRIKWLIMPEQFLAVVDAVQLNLLEQAKKNFDEAQAKSKIVVPNPKIQVFS